MRTQIRGMVTKIESGTVHFSDGVRVHVPVDLLKNIKVNQTLTLYVHPLNSKKGQEFYGFSTPSDLALFLAWLNFDDDNPVGILSMVSANMKPPKPKDEDADAIARNVEEVRGMLAISLDTVYDLIAQTDVSEGVVRRSIQVARLLGKLRDKEFEI